MSLDVVNYDLEVPKFRVLDENVLRGVNGPVISGAEVGQKSINQLTYPGYLDEVSITYLETDKPDDVLDLGSLYMMMVEPHLSHSTNVFWYITPGPVALEYAAGGVQLHCLASMEAFVATDDSYVRLCTRLRAAKTVLKENSGVFDTNITENFGMSLPDGLERLAVTAQPEGHVALGNVRRTAFCFVRNDDLNPARQAIVRGLVRP